MTIKKGDKISLDYEGKLDSGEIFDSSTHGDHSHPLEFEAGSGQVIKGFDEAVMGMKVGEEKTFTIKPMDAYGMPDPRAVQKVPRKMLPKDQEPKVGMVLVMATPDGHQMPAKITALDNETITIDLNHPLAGKALTFKIKILKIN